jgi:uncharacterized membrane protein YfcA
LTIALLALLVTAGAVAQAVSGIGFGLVCGPILVGTLGPADGVRTTVVLSFVVNVVVLARSRRDVYWKKALGLLLPAVVATPVLAIWLRQVPDRVGQVLAGLAAVVGASALALGVRWPAADSRKGMIGAGVVSAAMNDAAGIGGPAVALWADNTGWSPEVTRGTLQVYFLALNAVAMLTLGLPHQPGSRYAVELAALAGGLAAGTVVAGRIPSYRARQVTLGLAMTGGLVVIARALSA